MVPNPDPVIISVLAGLPALADTVAGRVSVVLSDTLPAIRVAKVWDLETPSEWEATPIYQVEVWAADELVAGDIAWALRDAWTSYRREVVGSAVVHGRWVEINPRSAPDTDNDTADTGTDFARSILTVGLRLSGAPTS